MKTCAHRRAEDWAACESCQAGRRATNTRAAAALRVEIARLQTELQTKTAQLTALESPP